MVGKTAQENPLNFGFENVLIQFDSESSRKAGQNFDLAGMMPGCPLV